MEKHNKYNIYGLLLLALMYAAIVLWLFSCTGCATVPPQPKIVNVEVPVPCKIQPVVVPAWAIDQLAKTDTDIYDLSKAFAVERTQRIQYEALLLAAIQGCQ